MTTIAQALERLARSKFRSSFHLTASDRKMIAELGEEKLRLHAQAFVQERLAPAFPKNDGKQTPYRGHPVFKAMHATAMCCRGCMNKWWKVPQGVPLTPEQQEKVVAMLLAWLSRA